MQPPDDIDKMLHGILRAGRKQRGSNLNARDVASINDMMAATADGKPALFVGFSDGVERKFEMVAAHMTWIELAKALNNLARIALEEVAKEEGSERKNG